MKEIERDRRAAELVIEKIGDVKANDRVSGEPRHDEILRVIEDPRVVPARRLAPGRESCVKAFGIRGIEEFDQPREPSRAKLKRQRPAKA